MKNKKKEVKKQDYITEIERLKEQIKELSREITDKTEDCQLGSWCDDCKHLKYAVVTYNPYYDIRYCGKHTHLMCKEWERKT